MSDSYQIEAITHRLSALERQNRRFKLGMLVALSCFSIVVSFGFAAPDVSESIKAKDFQLTDNKGQIRARLYFNNRGPMLSFLDASNKHRISLSLRDEQPSFVLADGSTKERLMAGSNEKYTWLKLYDAKEKLLWQAPTSAQSAANASVLPK